jgi:hypothetical protein
MSTLQKWIRIVNCSDLEPGEIVREGAEPYSDHAKQLVVEEVDAGRIVFADGSSILGSELSGGRFWHIFKNSPW